MPLFDVSPGSLADIRCRVYNSGVFSLPNNTNTAITFDSEDYDPRGMHSTSVNTSRINIAVDGRYWVYGHCLFQVIDSGAGCFLGVQTNGVGWTGLFAAQESSGGNQPYRTTSGIVTLHNGDYVELVANQNHGSSVNLSGVNFSAPEFEVQLIAMLGS